MDLSGVGWHSRLPGTAGKEILGWTWVDLGGLGWTWVDLGGLGESISELGHSCSILNNRWHCVLAAEKHQAQS